MNLRLLLEDYLSLMREEGELDVFLPLLLAAMGHETIIKAQKGPRQYGVDILTIGPGKGGRRTLHMWLVKRGDIGRPEWSATEQSVRQSIDDVGDVYLATHIAPQFKRLPKKLIVLTNGEYKSNIVEVLAQYLEAWEKRHQAESEYVGISTLATWTEKHLLDENALPSAGRTLFRRMLANISTPEFCVTAGREFIDSMIAEALVPADSEKARLKRHLTSLRAIRTALSILHVAGQKEDNLVAVYRLSEYALLAVWSKFQAEITSSNKPVITEFSELLDQMLSEGRTYHAKLDPYYRVKNAFPYSSADSIFANQRVFEELGRIGLCGYIWGFIGAQGDLEFARGWAEQYAIRLENLLATHGCASSPVYDEQALDIHQALLLLVMTSRAERAKGWLTSLVQRLLYAARVQKHLPLNATFDEVLAVHHGYEEIGPEMLHTSALIPLLAIWTSALGLDGAYSALRSKVVPSLADTTLTAWSPDAGFDSILSEPSKLQPHGVGEDLTLPEDPKKFLIAMCEPLAGVQPIAKSSWYQFGAPYMPLLSSLHWRMQAPREMIAKQVAALAAAVEPKADYPQAPAAVPIPSSDSVSTTVSVAGVSSSELNLQRARGFRTRQRSKSDVDMRSASEGGARPDGMMHFGVPWTNRWSKRKS